MWEDRKKQELKEAAIAVPRATQGIYDRHHNIIGTT
jgi:hypothetical protein